MQELFYRSRVDIRTTIAIDDDALRLTGATSKAEVVELGSCAGSPKATGGS